MNMMLVMTVKISHSTLLRHHDIQWVKAQDDDLIQIGFNFSSTECIIHIDFWDNGNDVVDDIIKSDYSDDDHF